jgi:hypothetical protein
MVNPNPDSYLKKCIYDSQKTNMKQRGLPVGASLPRCTPIGCLGVIYDSQPVKLQKNTTTNRWKLNYRKIPLQTGGSSYFLMEKIAKTDFLL